MRCGASWRALQPPRLSATQPSRRLQRSFPWLRWSRRLQYPSRPAGAGAGLRSRGRSHLLGAPDALRARSARSTRRERDAEADAVSLAFAETEGTLDPGRPSRGRLRRRVLALVVLAERLRPEAREYRRVLPPRRRSAQSPLWRRPGDCSGYRQRRRNRRRRTARRPRASRGSSRARASRGAGFCRRTDFARG